MITINDPITRGKELPQNLKLPEEKLKFCDIDAFFQIRKINVENAELYRALIS